MSPLTTLQLVLIAIGVIFQFMAFSALRKASGGRGAHASGEERTAPANFELRRSGNPKRIVSRPSALRSKQAQDYYEMEKMPPGMRPGELPKTAKVAYFDGVKPASMK
jgi:hypothetical protein